MGIGSDRTSAAPPTGSAGGAAGSSAGRQPPEVLERRRLLWALPSGLYLVGVAVPGPTPAETVGVTAPEDESARTPANLMTASWVMQVAREPCLLAISLEATSVTRRLVELAGVCAVSLVDPSQRELTRRFVKPVAGGNWTLPVLHPARARPRASDRGESDAGAPPPAASGLAGAGRFEMDRFEVEGVPLSRAASGCPVLADGPGYLDCRVVERYPLGSHELLVAEVVEAVRRGGDPIPRVLRVDETRYHYGG